MPEGDRQLLDAAASGDADAWGAIVEVYAGTVWFAALHCGLREDEAVQVSRLVWMGLLEALPHVDVPLETWLVAASTREAQQARLRTARRAATSTWEGDRRSRPRTASGAG